MITTDFRDLYDLSDAQFYELCRAHPDTKFERTPGRYLIIVLELMSPSDKLAETQAKMDEYLRSGVRLGWLINRPLRCVWIYRPETPPQRLETPSSLSGKDVLPGFTLNMQPVW